MKKQLFARMLAIARGLVVCGAALADAWLFFGFMRYYFPKSPVSGLFVHFFQWVLMLAYFASVAFTARWDSLEALRRKETRAVT